MNSERRGCQVIDLVVTSGSLGQNCIDLLGGGTIPWKVMVEVEAGKRACLVSILFAFLVVVSDAGADVYLKQDAHGVLHFTNVPTERGYKVIFRAPKHKAALLLRRHRVIRHSRFDRLISEIAARHGVEKELVKAVIKAESDFRPTAVSHKGAAGLMQLMPGTAARHRVRDVFDPRQNVEGGVRHLSSLIKRYRGDLVKALAAYNAGEGAVDAWGGVPHFRETREYVHRVLKLRQSYLDNID